METASFESGVEKGSSMQAYSYSNDNDDDDDDDDELMNFEKLFAPRATALIDIHEIFRFYVFVWFTKRLYVWLGE